jgi:hypothetical protein
MNAGAPAIAETIVDFGRLLRAAGLPIGLSAVHDAVAAAALVGPEQRDDFYWALHSALVKNRESTPLFDQAFNLIWTVRADAAMTDDETARASPAGAARTDVSRRLQDALGSAPSRAAARRERESIMAAFRFAPTAAAQTKDFASMSAAELSDALRAVQSLAFPEDERRTRRLRNARRGRSIDWRRTLRASLRTGGALVNLPRREARTRPQPVVLLIDISGSMETYARILLGFAHALLQQRAHASVFLFGTDLANVTRLMRHRDVDEALTRVGARITDWSGGTRIGASLARFNRLWSRRVLARGGHVLLMTDGLDRAGGEGLAKETARLQRSCDRLIWLNPLLRYEAFEPKAAGVRAILPYVDAFRPVHNLASIAQLVRALARGE